MSATNSARLRSSDLLASKHDDRSTEEKREEKKEEKKKDRIKTLDQFGTELNLLMETKIKHDEKAKECKELTAQLKTLRARVLPFLLENLKQTRANSAQHKMYISSTIVHRFRKVHINDVYQIIESELGTENRKLIEEKAKELRKQKVAMRQTRIAKMSTKRADKRKERSEEEKAAMAAKPRAKRPKKE